MAGARQEDAREDPALARFQQQWRVYRNVVNHDYMQHREVYARRRPPGYTGAGYHGIDLSGPALELAREALRRLDCPATLEQRDFAAALRTRAEPADVPWVGQSLHHLATPDKLAVMRDIHRLLGVGGLFLLWEPTRFDGEDRDAGFRRFEMRCRPWWAELTPEEWDAMATHTRGADFPETASGWLQMGRDAGFRDARELMQAPSDLARVYCFQA